MMPYPSAGLVARAAEDVKRLLDAELPAFARPLTRELARKAARVALVRAYFTVVPEGQRREPDELRRNGVLIRRRSVDEMLSIWGANRPGRLRVRADEDPEHRSRHPNGRRHDLG